MPNNFDLPEGWTQAELGEAYYSALESGDPADMAGFWQDFTTPFLETLDEENPWTGYTGDAAESWFGPFMEMYGQYLPQDLELGPASLDRIGRMTDIEKTSNTEAMMRNLETSRFNVGAAGFSGGMNFEDDLYNQYLRQQQATEMSGEADVTDIHSQFGEDVFTTFGTLSELGAFTEDPYIEYETGFDCTKSYEEQDCTGYEGWSCILAYNEICN